MNSVFTRRGFHTALSKKTECERGRIIHRGDLNGHRPQSGQVAIGDRQGRGVRLSVIFGGLILQVAQGGEVGIEIGGVAHQNGGGGGTRYSDQTRGGSRQSPVRHAQGQGQYVIFSIHQRTAIEIEIARNILRDRPGIGDDLRGKLRSRVRPGRGSI